jgi:HAD superfamily hydrolase (TIGR01662 family)
MRVSNRDIALRPALCLDFDGTIRKSKSGTFIKDEKDIELMPGIEKIIWMYRNMGFLIIGISNQGGVSFGHKTHLDIDNERDATVALFNKNPFHVIKMCYHMEGGKVFPFNVRSLFRKPDIGMLAMAEFECWNAGFMIDWDKSIFVGDREEDKKCAENARIKFHHIDEFMSMPHEFKI